MKTYVQYLMFIFLLLFILLLGILVLFSFPRFSPIPYFPSNKKDLPLILKALQLKNDQTLFDIGAGDGIVIFEAAKEAKLRKLDTQFIAIDINPVLVFVMHLRRLFHPNKKNIRIVWGDLFKTNYHSYIGRKTSVTIYLYVSPWLIEKIKKHITTSINKKQMRYITYYYPIPSLKKKEHTEKGINSVFTYTI